jgi:hypothetical protein
MLSDYHRIQRDIKSDNILVGHKNEDAFPIQKTGKSLVQQDFSSTGQSVIIRNHDTAVGCDRGPSPATHPAFSLILSVFVRFIIQDLVRAYRSEIVLFINTSIQHLSFSRLSISTCRPPPFTLTIFSLSTFICHNAVSTSL